MESENHTESRNLTAKQEKAAQLYVLQGKSKSDAYREAGYSIENMKDETIQNEAYKLFNLPHVSTRVENLKEIQLKASQVTVERVIAEYSKLAFLDPNELFYSDGSLRPLNEISPDARAAITGIEIVEETVKEDSDTVSRVKKIKLADKKGSLDSLSKILSMFVERHEHTGKDGKPIETKDVSATEAARRIAFLLNSAVRKEAPKE